MEMHQIRYFLAVADILNFTRAAEACNVSQPALTRAIQKLEEELGGLLFRRERSLTHLTDLGRLMRPHLTQVLHGTEAAKTTAKGFLKLDNAPLNLGALCTLGPLRLVAFLSEFGAKAPGVQVSIVEATPSRLTELLIEGRIDVAVTAQPQPYAERLDFKPLYRERFVVGMPVGHRLTAKNAVALSDLSGESYLDRTNCEYAGLFDEVGAARGVDWKVVYRNEREDWVQAMVAAGLGVCLAPEFSIAPAGVATRPLIDPTVEREVAAVTVAGRRFSPAVAAFVRCIRAYRWPDALPLSRAA